MAKILLVEDDTSIREMLSMRLMLHDHEVHEAENGKVGVEKALAEKFDLVLTDMHMPVMDGHEAVQTLRKQGYPGLIVAVTASAMTTNVSQAKEDGCDAVITKPISGNFESLVEQILEGE